MEESFKKLKITYGITSKNERFNRYVAIYDRYNKKPKKQSNFAFTIPEYCHRIPNNYLPETLCHYTESYLLPGTVMNKEKDIESRLKSDWQRFLNPTVGKYLV